MGDCTSKSPKDRRLQGHELQTAQYAQNIQKSSEKYKTADHYSIQQAIQQAKRRHTQSSVQRYAYTSKQIPSKQQILQEQKNGGSLQSNNNYEMKQKKALVKTNENLKNNSAQRNQQIENTQEVVRQRKRSGSGSSSQQLSGHSSYNKKRRNYIAGLQVISEASIQTTIRRGLSHGHSKNQNGNGETLYNHSTINDPYRFYEEVVKNESFHYYGPSQQRVLAWATPM